MNLKLNIAHVIVALYLLKYYRDDCYMKMCFTAGEILYHYFFADEFKMPAACVRTASSQSGRQVTRTL